MAPTVKRCRGQSTPELAKTTSCAALSTLPPPTLEPQRHFCPTVWTSLNTSYTFCPHVVLSNHYICNSTPRGLSFPYILCFISNPTL